jgi:sec-independent protein translocase protein TatA
MPNIGPLEIVIIIAIVALIFGATRIPDLGRSLGTGMREFKDGVLARGRDRDSKPEAAPKELPAAGSKSSRTHAGDEAPAGADTRQRDPEKAGS